MTENPQCPLCGGSLRRKTISSGNAGGIALALIVLFIGIVISATGIGMLIGLPICVLALFMGGRREAFLVCDACGAKHPAVRQLRSFRLG